MDSVEIVYYTCLNQDCERYRSVFAEGDLEHQNCAREQLWLESEGAGLPGWLLIALPVALAAMATLAVIALRSMRGEKRKGPMLRGQGETKTWSGGKAHREDREGSAVPPPIKNA